MALLLATGTPAAAQVRLFGQVVDNETGNPIAGAQVILLDAQGRWTEAHVVGDDGNFEFTVKQRGPYRLRGSRLGYQENTTPRLYLGEHSTVRVELRLDVRAVLLAPLEVVARSPARNSPVLESFRNRLRSGVGTFLTRDDILRRQPSRVTDLLATVSGVRLESIGRGGAQQRVVYMRSACPAQIFVDGLLLNRPGASLAVDDVVLPGNVEGIEIYGGNSTIPAEFLNADARCGVVAIWTRRAGPGGG